MTTTQEKVSYLLTQLKQEVDRNKQLAESFRAPMDDDDARARDHFIAQSEAYDESFNLVAITFREESEVWRKG